MKFFPWQLPPHFLDEQIARLERGEPSVNKLVNTFTVEKFVEYDVATLKIWREIQELIVEKQDIKAFKKLNDNIVSLRKEERKEIRLKLMGLIRTISDNPTLLSKSPLQVLVIVMNIISNDFYWDCEGGEEATALRDELVEKENLNK